MRLVPCTLKNGCDISYHIIVRLLITNCDIFPGDVLSTIGANAFHEISVVDVYDALVEIL